MAPGGRILRAGALSLALAGPIAAGESIPESILALEASGRAHAIVVEKETEKLFLYRGRPGRAPELVRSWNATTGQNDGDKTSRGDHKTPEGIYFFTRFLEDEELPAEYGARAVVLDYPNLFDARKGKTGDGIWLHATDELVRPLTSRQTRGCVVVTNHDVLQISRYIELDETPIVIQQRLRRLEPAAWEAERREVLGFLDGWLRAWEQGDGGREGAAYGESFRAEGKGRAAWLEERAAARRAAGRLELELVQPLVLRTGNEAVVRAGLILRGESKASYARKTLWLERGEGRWQIVAEQSAPATAGPEVAGRLKPLAPRVAAATSVPAPPGPLVAALPAARPPRGLPPLPGVGVPTPRPGRSPAAAARNAPAPPSPAPASAALPVRVRDFLADAGPGDLRVSFRLERSEPAAAKAASGFVSLVVRLRTPEGKAQRLVWPPGASLQGEEPHSAEQGDWYSVRRFKLVEARLPGLAPGATLEAVSLHVWDGAGRKLYRQDYGG